MKPYRIYVGGVGYGAGNIGDDGILQAILRILEAAIPDAIITVGTFKGKRLNQNSKDIQYIDYENLQQVKTAIKECDCFVTGGATVITDELSTDYPLMYNAKLISIAKFYGKRVAMLGIGANRLRHDLSLNVARTILKLCDIITLRDQESLMVCEYLNAKPRRIFVTADPAFLLKGEETVRTKEVKQRLRSKGKVIGVNVINEAWADQTAYKIAIAKACDELYARHGYTPVFFENEVRLDRYFDFQANKETALMLHCPYEILEPVYYTPGEMIDLISGFDAIISMRMHGLIFAAIAGTPFVTISRVDKVDNFMRLFGLKASGSVNHCDSEKLITDIEHLLENREAFQSQVKERVAVLRQNSLKNIELLQNLLNERRGSRHKANVSSLRLALSVILFENKIFRKFHCLLQGKIN